MQIKPNKSPLRKGFWPFSFERSATFPPQADHVSVHLFSSVAAGGSGGRGGEALLAEPPHSFAAQYQKVIIECVMWHEIKQKGQTLYVISVFC